ncbi:hypothetical protein [Peribacillus alkalitolerans]|uniref:hypothetical protein n=1 Tax=Peribacillus alkalitolerans TaxID=1550385 RepID=UPI0013D23EFF|nr:hypothetical protein [Peribacillus alkalitolerans]
MLFESEARTFFEISIWVISIFLVIASLISLKNRTSGAIYFLLFTILHFISLLGLIHLLNTVDTDPVVASERNTLRFYGFIFPWLLSMILLMIGIFKNRVKQ